MRKLAFSILLSTVVILAGCRSRVIEVTLINASPQPLSIIVVDYPGATFGVNQLAANATYRYAVKPQYAGSLKIQFSDAQGRNHTYAGPALHKNDEGSITVHLTQDAATAESNLSRR